METLCRSSHTLDLLGKPQSEPQIEHPALAHATVHVGKIHSKSGMFLPGFIITREKKYQDTIYIF